MSRASLVMAVIGVLGAVVAWRFLPARASDAAHVDAAAASGGVATRQGVRQPASARPIGQLRPVPPRPQ